MPRKVLCLFSVYRGLRDDVYDVAHGAIRRMCCFAFDVRGVVTDLVKVSDS